MSIEQQLDQETVDKAVEAVKKLAEAIVVVYNKVVELIKNAINAFWETLREFLKQINTKIYHLAYHGKKWRVRKKNKKRLYLLFGRWLSEQA